MWANCNGHKYEYLWMFIDHSQFCLEFVDLGRLGISIGTYFWYWVYSGYFSQDIFSVKVVEPKNNKFNKAAPIPDKLSPTAATLKRNMTHHIQISQKKLGWRLYRNRPVVMNPFLYGIGRLACLLLFYFSILYF